MSNGNNLLRNGDFSGGWWRETFTGQEFGNVFVPKEWIAWWLENKDVPHDPSNQIGYVKPEMAVINYESPYINPPRVLPEGSDAQAVKLFSFYKIHQAGLMQTIDAIKGSWYKLGGYAHAWSSTDDNPWTSDGAGDKGFYSLASDNVGHNNALRNITFRVGVDITGGEDPWLSSIVWGEPVNIYNVYHALPELLFQAQADQITVYIKSDVLWPFKHCDAYLDNFYLYECSAPQLPDFPDYDSTSHLLPQTATVEQALEAMSIVYTTRGTILFSEHDVVKLGGNVIVYYWQESQIDKQYLESFFAQFPSVTSVTWHNMGGKASFPVGSIQWPPERWYLANGFKPTHPGLDLNLDEYPWGDVERGEPVFAILDGVVHYVTDNWGGVGMCVVAHSYNGRTLYARYAHIDPIVAKGQAVKAGDILGPIGNWTGGDGGDHLHLDMSYTPYTREWIIGGPTYVDPTPILKDLLDPYLVDEMFRKQTSQPVVPVYSNYTNNLIGLHRCNDSHEWDNYFVQGQANLDKSFSCGQAVYAHKINPNAHIIWRKYFYGGDEDNWFDMAKAGEAKQSARLIVDQYENELRAYAQNEMGGDYEGLLNLMDGIIIECLNERYVGGRPDINKPMVQLDIEFCREVSSRFGGRLLPGVFTAPIGNPEPSDYNDLIPLAAVVRDTKGFMGYHAYWTATKERSFLVEHWPYHAGRWQTMDDLFTSKGIYVRWYLGEIGIVASACPDGTCFITEGGYHNTLGWELYFRDIKQFNDLLLSWNATHQNRCAGGVIFAYTCNNWDGFNLHVDHVKSMIPWGASIA